MTFYFFDLETSGFRAREDRIMQFAGQRTDMDLKAIGKPDNILVKLSEDVLPSPDAVLVHGISPLKTQAEGMTEAELAKYLTSKVFTPDTIAVGFNNIRFDNEFIRFLFWRNFTDAYEWSWKDGCSTWDLLDVVRACRALRPDGIAWPFNSDGKPANKLELLASINKLKHASAHDALSDVLALVDLARLIKDKQPKLFDYLLTHRSKDKIAPLVSTGLPVIYTSGRYTSEWQKTTVAAMVAPHPQQNAALMYDLRIDPERYTNMTSEQLKELWAYKPNRSEDDPYFPVKVMKYNRCPAVVGDLRVLDKASQKRLGLHMEIIDQHYQKLKATKGFGDKLVAAVELMSKPYQKEMIVKENLVDGALYDGFIADADKIKMRTVRAADDGGLKNLQLDFADERLKYLLPLYKARNFPTSLNAEQKAWWQSFRQRKLTSEGRLKEFNQRLSELAAQPGLDAPKQHLIEDLRTYAESLVPAAQSEN